MGKPVKIAIEQIRRVHEILDKTPDAEPDAVTRRVAIGKLSVAIARLQSRGHSLQRIAEILSANGIPITRETLSTYLTLSKRSAEATKSENPAPNPKSPSSTGSRSPRAGRSSPTTSSSESKATGLTTRASAKRSVK